MKRILFLLVISSILQACEKVVDVDLNDAETKLVIEATGIQKEDEPEGQLTVKLSETAPYFDDSIPRVSDAEIGVEIEGKYIPIPETQVSGYYQSEIPMLYDQEYELYIKVKDEEYQGHTKLYQTAEIDYITQSEGIFDPDETRVEAFYTDPPDEENFYLFSFLSKHGRTLSFSDDEFYDGLQTSTTYTEEFNPGDSITVSINGTSSAFNRYISTLILGDGQTGNPFATAPATVRGNMKNIANPDNFPLGYFRMSQEFHKTYIIE